MHADIASKRLDPFTIEPLGHRDTGGSRAATHHDRLTSLEGRE